ncbi:MAG: hypothetical protein COZ70_09550 [Deltaproteobacteria bacterium CG_4_8_14_3_um_filter_51_11]|nr:UPF0280 family protein [bacterium]PIP46418.1 MAG: hypothetical protein COX16_09175 [Deltaproteobacteria bacterium CG23_combo_of_CG06-09_8_20_14_all_51_20]PIX19340.1 MAG: hypothetical protein COZ70_09550 [Deltaproteobacteria bacterium CG_4_8_14_3_um_filter_51_11]PIY23511.1 MAG: hypothetical protein COZ11_09435 [Deltaproteobacteria bacterium CG_4_10_14_3_um_filter_51_14]PJB35091.1 MAG: hypothetical protein CO107_11495 [Deltaproteobacteria bacterium CG_4_9_14_3_um_filter_51_14]
MKETETDFGRPYRLKAKPAGMTSFRIAVRETDLWISAEKDLRETALELTLECRREIEAYIKSYPSFLKTLVPWRVDPFAPTMVKSMVAAAARLGIGPMATVAGTIAEFVGKELLKFSDQVIVENGGDVFLSVKRPCTVSILAGISPLTGLTGIKIRAQQTPLGVCTSSGTVGHSLSYGRADAVCVVAKSACFADGAATALANRVTRYQDLQALPALADYFGEILGGVGIVGQHMIAWGEVELVDLTSGD